MADELSTPPAADAVGTDTIAKTPAVKKTRAPRRPKAVAEVATSEAVAPPKGRRGGRRKAEAVEDAAAPTETKRKVRGPAKAATAQKASTPAAAVSVSDDLADLLQLEEENKRLRKTLAEKLRAENADLRRRIES
ncbi:SyrB-like regulator [Rhizobium leguminosarum]|uniref:SyrB-like regulator n=1 Tax=Rhizobium leguminosarum TaxID=384 RepID=UPI00143F7A7D|nr:SyrB-like regulator [Rhizobium leguminosarum]NKL23662.1 SyrB-like regulator [Rhizobium leguminosarum bv. viciae]